ncbi:MAG: hypothetical protein QOH47_2423 [Sphingomonadales bacterium]|jgi:hypothetical protein|nr:hypothetical protein [Sphingomonadales bacterium]
MILIALALVSAPLPADEARIRYDWEGFYCERQAEICPLTRRARADGIVTPAELRRIERHLSQIGCAFGIRDTEPCGEENNPPSPDRVVMTLEDFCTGDYDAFVDADGDGVVHTCPAETAPQPDNAYWNDVAAETDYPNDTMAQAYCEWRSDFCRMVSRAMRSGHVSDRELAVTERAAMAPGYGPNDVRCTADDRENCPNLRRIRR